jgi:hypothetical protein
MAHPVLIIGPSGTGKSTSLENMDHTETFIIKATDKPLPFRGSNKRYTLVSEDNPGGNLFVLNQPNVLDRYRYLKSYLKKISDNRPDIKNIVIDDFQYLMIDEYMRRASEKGYEKFAEMAVHSWEITELAPTLREDLNVIFISHSDINEEGVSCMQSIGKMLKNVVKPDGRFTVALHTFVDEGKYKFLTQRRSIKGQEMLAKSPKGMFEDDVIDNDLRFVVDTMKDYYDFDDVNM